MTRGDRTGPSVSDRTERTHAAVSVLLAPLLLVQAQPQPTFVGGLLGLLLPLAIALGFFLVVNTSVMWITSNLMSFPRATAGRAFRLALLQLLIPVPAMLLLGRCFCAIARHVLAQDPASPFLAVGYAVCGAIIVGLIVSVMITAFVYGVGFFRAAAFNTLSWVILAFLGFMLGLGGVFMQCATGGTAGK